jgi:hypothetical protein
LKSSPPRWWYHQKGLWEMMRSWGWTPHEWQKGPPDGSLAPSTMWGHKEKYAACKPKNFAVTNHHGTLAMAFWPPEWEWFLLFVRHAVYGALSLQLSGQDTNCCTKTKCTQDSLWPYEQGSHQFTGIFLYVRNAKVYTHLVRRTQSTIYPSFFWQICTPQYRGPNGVTRSDCLSRSDHEEAFAPSIPSALTSSDAEVTPSRARRLEQTL